MSPVKDERGGEARQGEGRESRGGKGKGGRDELEECYVLSGER